MILYYTFQQTDSWRKLRRDTRLLAHLKHPSAINLFIEGVGFTLETGSTTGNGLGQWGDSQ